MSSPKRRIPRSTLVPLLLLVYLAVMSYIGWGNYAKGETSALYYFGTIGVTLVIILLLHFNLKRREALRQKRLDDMAASRDVSTAKGTGSDAQA
ncbi:MAG: hypothetical protein PUC94_02270 [Bacteroidales bacterium]|nr:hypothetical protein [Bacteroidales bacterium]MDD6722728.1 hypothetical protein [Bacteroidales bacterium]